MKALKPMAPASAMASMWSSESGVSPPQSAKSRQERFSPMRRFSSKAARVMTGGLEFSGMSKKVVPPPAARAREPVVKPSQSARPGSLKWTWASIQPGRMRASRKLISSRAVPESEGPAAVMNPSEMAKEPLVPWTRRSWSLMRVGT